MIAPVIFAAGIGDWLEALLPALVGLFWIASQVFNALKAARRGGQPPPVVRQPRPRVAPVRAEEIRAELERQIGEFLERPRPQAARPRPPAAAPATRQATRQTPPATVRVASQPASPARRPPAAGNTDVARHVEAAFAHDLEHLTSSLAASAPAATEPRRPAAATAAAELAAALRNPATLRQMVLLREVLERPVDRW